MKKYLSILFAMASLAPTLAQDGNVGVNTQNPEAKFDVVSTNSGIMIPRIALTGTNVMAPVVGANVSELIYNTATAGSGSTAVSPGYYFWSGSAWTRLLVAADVNDDDDFYDVATGLPPTSINADIYTQGNVGIGSATPATRLDVNGVVTVHSGGVGAPVAGVAGGAGRRLVLWPMTNDVSYGMGIAGQTMWSAVPSTAAHRWYTGTTTRMIITSDGNVGIGTATPGQRLDVTGNTRTSGDFIGRIAVEDTRSVDAAPNTYDQEVHFEFKNRSAIGVGGSGLFGGTMTFAPWGDNSGGVSHQLHLNAGGLFWRQGQPDALTWGSWEQLAMISDLPEADADWYEVGTTNPPSDINADIYTQGKVGIGTITPTTNSRLTVTGPSVLGNDALSFSALTGFEDIIIRSGTSDYLIQTQDGNGRVQHKWNASYGTGETFLVGGEDAFFMDITGDVTNAPYFEIKHADGSGAAAGDPISWNTHLAIKDDGTVGIGTTNPSATLDVVGSLQLDLSGTETAGHVLITDASGNASWSGNLPDNDNGYIWNQEASAQTGADFWIDGNGTLEGTLKLNSNDAIDKIYLTNSGATGSQINHNSGWTIEYQAGPGNSGTTGEHAFFTTEGGVYKEQMTITSDGDVGIGDASPSVALSVVGAARASFAADETEYTEMGHGGSNAYINYNGDGNLNFRRAGTDAFSMEQDGDLKMEGDNSVKMPNNIAFNGSDGVICTGACTGWMGMGSTTTGACCYTLNVEAGNYVHVTVTGLARFQSGSGTDDLTFRIRADKVSGACSGDLLSDEYGPWRTGERTEEHDNYRTFSYQYVFSFNCSGIYEFDAEVNPQTDDPIDITDVKIVATKY